MIQNEIDYVDEKEEETQLYANIPGLQIINDELDYRRLLSLKNEQLCVMYQNNTPAALTALIEKNKRFIYQLAIKLHSQYRQSFLEVEDLFIEGTLGLIDAAQRFDSSLDFNFTTYSWHWVRQRITRSIMNTGFLVRLPVHVLEKIIRINACRIKHPSISQSELLEVINDEHILENRISSDELREFLVYESIYLNISSLNTLAGDDEDSELINFISNNNSDLDQIVLKSSLEDEIKLLLQTLTPREEKVIRLRYGFDSNIPETLEEIGKELGVTRERVRQIQRKAIRKLVKSQHCKNLKNYLEE